MSNVEQQAAGVTFPAEGDICVVAITTSSAATKLTGSSSQFGAAGSNEKHTARMLTMIADVDFYFVFGDSAVTVDETATTGDTRAALWPAYTPLHGKLPSDEAEPLYIALKGTAAGKLRIWPSSNP